MRFKNYHIPGLFDDFADADNLELGDSIGSMTHEEGCKHRIPTKEEIHYLIAIGAVKPGDTSFWSSSVYSDSRCYAWIFYGGDGGVSNGYRYYDIAVRCVRR